MADATLLADKVLVSGPSVDGSYKVTFIVGEDSLVDVAKLVPVKDVVLKVEVTLEDYAKSR